MYAIAVTALVLSIYMYPTVNAACDLTKLAECAQNRTVDTDTEKCAAITTITECLKTKVCAGGELDARMQEIVKNLTTTLNVDCGGGDPTVYAACDLTKLAECPQNGTAGTDTEKCAALTTYTECLKTKVCAGGELDARVQEMVTHMTTTLNVDCGGGDPTVYAACDLTKLAECPQNGTAGTDTEKCAALTTYTECLKTKVCAGGELDARVQKIVTLMTTTLNVDCGGGENGAGLPSGDSALVLAITSFFLLLFRFHG